MRCAPNPPSLFKEQRRRVRDTWPAATSSWGLRAGGGRLLIHLVCDSKTGSQAEKSNHNPTKHHVSLKTEDRNFEARRFNIHRVLGAAPSVSSATRTEYNPTAIWLGNAHPICQSPSDILSLLFFRPAFASLTSPHQSQPRAMLLFSNRMSFVWPPKPILASFLQNLNMLERARTPIPNP